jgi:HD superfamily phosphohydrolase YqeK
VCGNVVVPSLFPGVVLFHDILEAVKCYTSTSELLINKMIILYISTADKIHYTRQDIVNNNVTIRANNIGILGAISVF